MIAGLAERAQAPSATLSLGPISQGRGDVAVAGWQGRQVGCGRAGVHAPPPGADPPLINSFGTTTRHSRYIWRHRARRRRAMSSRSSRTTSHLVAFSGRQTPGLLPELRRPTHGRECGVARGRGLSRAAGAPMPLDYCARRRGQAAPTVGTGVNPAPATSSIAA